MDIVNKRFYAKCGTINQVNAYLKRMGCEDYMINFDFMNPNIDIGFYDYDGHLQNNDYVAISYNKTKDMFGVCIMKYNVVE